LLKAISPETPEEEYMINNLLKKLQGPAKLRPPFDPAQLNDPVALLTGWTPAKGGGANFRTHKLVNVNSFRLEFRASAGAIVFYLLFLLIGLGVLIGFTVFALSSVSPSLGIEMLIPIVFGLVFTGVGGGMLYFGTVPVVFDMTMGCFWKGRKSRSNMIVRNTSKHFSEFDNIHALQLISEHCRGNKQSYYSYELNLVLKNGTRLNVVDHGNYDKIRKDADTLAAFLGKPVWDAI
jgi:hypothetical protein